VIKAPALGNLLAQQAATALLPSADKVDYVLAMAAPLSAAQTLLTDLEAVNLKTAIETTKEFGNSKELPKLKGTFAEVRAASQALAEVVRTSYVRAAFSAGEPSDAGPTGATQGGAALVATAIAALERLDKFYDETNPVLASLIDTRIARYQGDRRTGILLTLLGILLYVYIFAGFYVGIAELVASLGVATQRMIAGTTERFTTKNRDETANIVSDFNQINVALVEARELRARVEEENRQTQANIVDLLTVVSDASDGNLTARAVTTAGALGNVADAFNLLMESLEGLIGEVSGQVAASERAVQSIAEVAQQMAAGAASQATEVVAARTLVAGVAEQISAVSTNAEGASEATRHTAQTAQEGEQAVENVITGMDSLRANVQSGAKKMKNLGDRSMEITSIVGTISRISEQTNMLALNAAIEAARAGEHGRGFRVVADEVRKLAERATVATKDIEKLVKAINAETAETIKAIEQQTQVVEEESRTVSAAGESLRKIRAASDQSAQLVESITQVATAQVDSARRVATTMEAVSSIAARTQRGAESTVATIGDLVRVSTSLRASIGKFRISIAGAR
jgi:twitching motility protein PilJ